MRCGCTRRIGEVYLYRRCQLRDTLVYKKKASAQRASLGLPPARQTARASRVRSRRERARPAPPRAPGGGARGAAACGDPRGLGRAARQHTTDTRRKNAGTKDGHAAAMACTARTSGGYCETSLQAPTDCIPPPSCGTSCERTRHLRRQRGDDVGGASVRAQSVTRLKRPRRLQCHD